MQNHLCFRFSDLIIILCIIMLFASVVLPALLCSAGRSREAMCRNNLKLIGVGLELWRQHADKYPPYDLAEILNNPPNLAVWPDALMMTDPFTPENLEAHRNELTAIGYRPEYFIKTVDNGKIFRCPADQPHPHRINEERGTAWNFNPYVYSYALSISANNSYPGAAQRPTPDKQVISADGLWTWSQNLSCYWINDPNAHFYTGGWYCNTVGYWHKRNSANLLLRDLHIENHRYPPDTTKVYEWESGENLNVFH